MNINIGNKTGLVLSGGGAKGAYQAGVVRALAESGMRIDAISGASIGALNGAVLACSASVHQGAENLSALWIELSEESPIEFDKEKIFKQLVKKETIKQALTKVLLLLGMAHPYTRILLFLSSFFLEKDDLALLKDDPLLKLAHRYFSTEKLKNGTPLYASIYESRGAVIDFAQVVLAMAQISDTSNSKFVHVQSLVEEEQLNVLFASAAIPIAFAAKEIQGKKYSDGGQGGWNKLQGNTPMQALVDAKCDVVIVSHLEDGSLWNRHDFPNTTVIEIRPQSLISKNTISMLDMFDFSPSSIQQWMKQGYEDAMHCLQPIQKGLTAHRNRENAKLQLERSLASNQSSDERLQNALKKLK